MRTVRLGLWIVVIGAGLFCAPAEAIVIRHDLPDSLYRALGATVPAVGRLGSGHGTLVEPKWVLTAAHVAQELVPGFDKVRFGETAATVANVYLHSTWIGNLPPGYAEPEWLDFALVELETPVAGIAPIPMWRQPVIVGDECFFVGSGKTGDGRQGVTTLDSAWRGAYNRVHELDASWLVFLFDEPPSGEPLEGIAGPADSGSPALFPAPGGWAVAGVTSRNDGPNIGMVECTYGTREYYARVSAGEAWMDSVFAGTVPPRNPALANRGETSAEDPRALSPAEDSLYLAVARELIRCLDESDTTAYRNLFSASGWNEAIDWWRNGFAAQRRRFGPIVRAYPPQRGPVRLGKFGWSGEWDEGMSFVVIFEKEAGGALNFELDEAGRIAHSSVYVKEEIALYEDSNPPPPFFERVQRP